MASPVKLYQQEMHDGLGFFATWLPGDPMAIGDAGVLEGGRFRRVTTLADLGIECQTSTDGATQDVQYNSSQGAKIAASASAEVPGAARAQVSIDFAREGAFVFHASGMRPQRLENRTAVADAVVEAFKAGKWRKEWLLVESLHTAASATIIVSQDSSAGVVLMAKADIPLAAVSLADPQIGLSVASTRGRLVHVICGKALRPLYSCLRLSDPFFGQPSVEPVRGAHAGARNPLARPGIEELLES